MDLESSLGDRSLAGVALSVGALVEFGERARHFLGLKEELLMGGHLREALDDEGRKIFVELPHANLNLATRVLTGNETALIRREDFTVTGDRIEFNTKTRFGTLRGNIRMVLSSENTTP